MSIENIVMLDVTKNNWFLVSTFPLVGLPDGFTLMALTHAAAAVTAETKINIFYLMSVCPMFFMFCRG